MGLHDACHLSPADHIFCQILFATVLPLLALTHPQTFIFDSSRTIFHLQLNDSSADELAYKISFESANEYPYSTAHPSRFAAHFQPNQGKAWRAQKAADAMFCFTHVLIL